jgi:hypothetical protein
MIAEDILTSELLRSLALLYVGHFSRMSGGGGKGKEAMAKNFRVKRLSGSTGSLSTPLFPIRHAFADPLNM